MRVPLFAIYLNSTCRNRHIFIAVALQWRFKFQQVHGDLHGLLGGAFNCNTDMQKFHEDHPDYSLGLLSFVLEYLTFTYWPGNSFLPEFNTCDTHCEKGQTERCGCTCLIDAFDLSEDEVWKISSMSVRSGGRRARGGVLHVVHKVCCAVVCIISAGA